uniref:Immediate early response 3-interacting protein 1 n=1 Tax=Steinernema glaseri TaxID=37863 RepID=A0A1I7Z1U7_9BILA
MLSFYGLLEASLLVVNGLAIVNRERVLNKIVKNSQYSSFDNQESSVKMQLVNLVIAVQTVMRIPLIAINIFVILVKLVMG